MFPPRFSAPHGDGFTILEDAEVSFASKSDCKLPIRLRRVSIKRHDADDAIVLITQEMTHSATDIAALYKGRWQIELLLRSIKQHLKIRKFLANNDNAIRLQLFAAMIAYASPRVAQPAPTASLSKSSDSPISSLNASSTDAISPKSKSLQPSTQAFD